MMKTQISSPVIQRVPLPRLVRVGAFAVVIAVIANLIVHTISKNLLGIPFVIPPAPDSNESSLVSEINVVVDTVVMSVSAVLVFALLSRVSTHPVGLFAVISIVVLLLSFIFPLLLQVEMPMKIALSLMHVITAVVIVGTLVTQAR
jgi:hypothetical protein